jgi:DNA-damage-inducible protein J
MTRIIRSAILQARVTPGVKRAAEEILDRLGLTMTEAMELFLHRMIIDQRIPFEIVAFDPDT